MNERTTTNTTTIIALALDAASSLLLRLSVLSNVPQMSLGERRQFAGMEVAEIHFGCHQGPLRRIDLNTSAVSLNLKAVMSATGL